jgi:hypothetical protein
MYPLKPGAFGLSLAVSLSAITALCWIAVLILPQVQLAPRWLGLFTETPVGSVMGGIAAIVVSFAAGWVTAFLMAVLYNRLIKTGA